ncbi:MAG: CFI-box-CTERM domain-containing protein [Candidatus Bathyarchaeia archaeon]
MIIDKTMKKYKCIIHLIIVFLITFRLLSTSSILAITSINDPNLTSSYESSNILVNVITDKSLYAIGENINITLLISNVGSGILPIVLGGGRIFIYDAQGKEVYYIRLPDYWIIVDLQPGETISMGNAIWSQVDHNETQVPPGFYDIVGEYSLIKSDKLRIRVAVDFSLYLSRTSASTPRSILIDHHIATLTITSIGEISLPVSLSVLTPSSGIVAKMNPNFVILPPYGSMTSKLLISTSSSIEYGSHKLTIIATSDVITHSIDFTLTISPCMIATATYGSELAPEVQFLRDFRDKIVLNTFAGSNFMIAFNAWYYSFSPYIAEIIDKNSLLKEFMKIVLYPLIKMLQLSAYAYSMLRFNPEVAIIISGFVASALIGMIYFSPITIALAFLIKRRYAIKIQGLKLSLLFLIVSIALMIIGEITALPSIMRISTVMFVLVTIILVIIAYSRILLKIQYTFN